MKYFQETILTIKSFRETTESCIICGRAAFVFSKADTTGSDLGHRRYACCSNHYDKILYLENIK
jgi:hypothetical protein